MWFNIFQSLFIYSSILTIVLSDGQHNFFDPDVGHIRDEVKEHYRIDLDNNTSEQELNWYYFEMHDFDKNLVLDGLEILTAINHVIDSETLKNREVKEIPLLGKDDDSDDPLELIRMHESYRTQIRWNEKFDFDSKIIDKLLEEYDSDNDGFISYTEYIIARRDALKL